MIRLRTKVFLLCATVKTEQDVYGQYYVYSYNGNYRIFGSEENLDWQYRIKNKTIRGDFVDDSYVLTDYAQHLIPKAVGYSAGMIKLFMDEAKKDEKTDLPTFRMTLRGLADRVVGAVIAGAEQLYDSLKSKTAPVSLAGNSR